MHEAVKCVDKCQAGTTSECCSKIAEAEAAVSVNEKKWLVMHMHVQLKLDELRGPVSV
jgi:seryl-tRNA(Sec) selenium transferase